MAFVQLMLHTTHKLIFQLQFRTCLYFIFQLQKFDATIILQSKKGLNAAVSSFFSDRRILHWLTLQSPSPSSPAPAASSPTAIMGAFGFRAWGFWLASTGQATVAQARCMQHGHDWLT